MSQHRIDLDNENFRTSLARDVSGFLFGERIGGGQFREVYEYHPDPTLVAKIEDGYASFENILEHEIWRAVKSTEFACWFAPISQISGNGLFLLQKRTKPVARKDLPAKVPAFFTDLKPENWGWYRGRIVCHDYGRNLLMERGMTKAMRKADWS